MTREVRPVAGVLTASWAGSGDGADGGAPDGQGIDTIAKVVTALAAVRDASRTLRPPADGIAAFSELYEIITRNVLETAGGGDTKRRFQDPDFLIELDIQFARRYLAAIRRWETEADEAPKCWRILFDARGAGRRANHAAAGVNAHVNFDLALALLETWKRFPPNSQRRSDYDLVNDIFAEEMDNLRERFPTELSEIGEDGSPADEAGNAGSTVLVRWTRGFAWYAAEEVWEHYDPGKPDGGDRYQRARRRLRWTLDTFTYAAGVLLLSLDVIP